jgi:hypothetical protein
MSGEGHNQFSLNKCLVLKIIASKYGDILFINNKVNSYSHLYIESSKINIFDLEGQSHL